MFPLHAASVRPRALLLACILALYACGDSTRAPEGKTGDKTAASTPEGTPSVTAKAAADTQQASAAERLKQLEENTARLEQQNRQLLEERARLEQTALQREEALRQRREDQELRQFAQQERERLQAESARKEQALEERQAADGYRRYVKQLAARPSAQLNQMLIGCGGKFVPDTRQRYDLCSAIREALPIAARREADQAAAFYQDQLGILSQYSSGDLRARQYTCSNAPYFGSNTGYNECAAVTEALDYALQRERDARTIVPYPVQPYRPGREHLRDDEQARRQPPDHREHDREPEYTFTPKPGSLQQPKTPPGYIFTPARP